MDRNTREVGNKGEELAAEYLLKGGYEILKKNYRWRFGEIDIIAIKDRILCFCEVKRSRYAGESHPELRVDHKKQIKIVRTAMKYLTENTGEFDAVRFDILTIKSNKGRNFIEHLENAFWPPEGWDAEEYP